MLNLTRQVIRRYGGAVLVRRLASKEGGVNGTLDDMVAGLAGRQGTFTEGGSRQRALLGDVLEYETEHGGLEASDMNTGEEVVFRDTDEEDKHHYDAGDAGVSLYSVMQSQVPEPFNNHGRNPTHLNMPGGGLRQNDKYLADNQQNSHQSRQYHSLPNKEIGFGSPQGVQGENCGRYTLWVENCQGVNSECRNLLQGVQGSRRTLGEIFSEQEEAIYKIARSFQHKVTSSGGDQGPQDLTWIKAHSVQSLSHLENPCPQGVQGYDCERFKLWLNNCSKYGFLDCEEQLGEVRAGRKTLGQIFEEQEQEIEQAALRFSQSTRSEGNEVGRGTQTNSSSSSSSSPSNPGAMGPKLSQGKRLKQAVKEYGSTVIVFHVTISLMSLGGFYLAVSSGLDVVGVLQRLGVGQTILESRLATGASTFVVAYAVHKVFAPARIATTLTATPFIVRYLRRIGFLKTKKM